MAIQTFTSGQILTAAQMNTLQQQAVMTFTTEAARDAALTAPTEGMVAYLTAPTVPAATGTAAYLPSGIQTIYNGSAWVCVTGVGCIDTTSQSTTSTSFVDLATVDSVTLSTGTRALVTFFGGFVTAGATGAYSVVSVAVSGASTIAAANANGCFVVSPGGSFQGTPSRTTVISGLTAGVNTFTLKYRVTASTGTFENREIFVQGIV
jgi:hypothetical protein